MTISAVVQGLFNIVVRHGHMKSLMDFRRRAQAVQASTDASVVNLVTVVEYAYYVESTRHISAILSTPASHSAGR